MATDWVLDASIASKLFLNEVDSPFVERFFAEMPKDQRPIAPSLLRYEIGNACAKRGLAVGLEPEVVRFLAGIQTMEPRDIARFTDGLSYYDAAYLALAVEQKAGLLTADEKLRKAAKKHGIPVAP